MYNIENKFNKFNRTVQFTAEGKLCPNTTISSILLSPLYIELSCLLCVYYDEIIFLQKKIKITCIICVIDFFRVNILCNSGYLNCSCKPT